MKRTQHSNDIHQQLAATMGASYAERQATPWDWCAQQVDGRARIQLPGGGGMVDYDPNYTPYFKYWMAIAEARLSGQALEHDRFAHLTEQLYFIGSNQIGKTQGLIHAIMSRTMAVHNISMAMVFKRLEDLRSNRSTRIVPMIERNECLMRMIGGTSAQRDKRMGSRSIQYGAHFMHLLTGNTAADLRSKDVPLIIPDEFDMYPLDVDGEGDPLDLLLDRQKNFPHQRLLLGVTTPTLTARHGWQRLLTGTFSRMHIACKACQAHHWLDTTQVRATDGDATPDEILTDDLAAWHCPTCECPHRTADLRHAVAAACDSLGYDAAGGWMHGLWTPEQFNQAKGTWRAEQEDARDDQGQMPAPESKPRLVQSAQMNALYSPILTIGRYLNHKLAAHGKPIKMQAHINGWDGMCDTGAASTHDAEDVIKAATPESGSYQHGNPPAGGDWLILTCDQQGNTAASSWFPYVLRAWSQAGESWLVDCGEVQGFDELADLFVRKSLVGDIPMLPLYQVVDTANGPLTHTIRKWCLQDQAHRISMGGSRMDSGAAWAEMTLKAQNASRLAGLRRAWIINSNHFRDELDALLRGGTWHLPSNAPQYYLDSLDSEERVVEMVLTRGRREMKAFWRPRQYTDDNGINHVRGDNHWWDCEVMQLAWMTILGLFDVKQQEHRRAGLQRVGTYGGGE